jgi:hypothetical protein
VGTLEEVARRVKLFLKIMGARLDSVIGDCSLAFLLGDNEKKTTATKDHNKFVSTANGDILSQELRLLINYSFKSQHSSRCNSQKNQRSPSLESPRELY